MTNTNRIAPGTAVTLPDGTRGHASEDRRVGSSWDGTYRVSVWNPVTRGTAITLGWRREQLTVAA